MSGSRLCKLILNNGWKLREAELYYGSEMLPMVLNNESGWMNADLPCDIHMPLLENGIIMEPLEGENCYSSEWIEQKSWWFVKRFNLDDKLLNNDAVELVLESLDSEADIFLNGFHMAHHKSAFYAFTANIKEMLKTGENVLVVRLSSGLEYVSDADLAALKNCITTEIGDSRKKMGDKRRIFVRKPQYVYGWDWGPRVATCGIVKGAYIKAYDKLAVREVYAVTESITDGALISFRVMVENLHPYSTMDACLKLEILMEGEREAFIEQEVLLRSGLNYFNLEAKIRNPKLWWPNGMGDQPLYTVMVSAQAGETCSEYPAFKYGIRTLRLNLDKINENERSFTFEINGVKTFCKGGNWIPADSIYARVTDEKYNILVKEAREANFNMLRIWGGGIYERDIFYEKCDEYGILLWHDFMFACAAYPDNLEWFQREVEKEMDYQTKRLRNHPSIALWCGNNENHWGFAEWWVGENKPPFPGGAVCYNELAPRIVQQNCPDIPYWNGSPYGGEHPNGNEIGDRHHWNDCTMSQDMEKRITPEEYDKITSRFVSEYGYIGPCRKSSIIKYHGGTPLDKNSAIWQIHNNTFEKGTVLEGIKKHYADPKNLDIDQYLLYSGLCQGLMYGYSLEAIRYKEGCWGSLFWMYDDCWGEVGWTIIDYYLKRKPSYYFVKRAFMPIKLILRENEGTIRVMGINETPEAFRFDAEYGYAAFDGSTKESRTATVSLPPFSRSVVLEFPKGNYDLTRGICYVRPIKETNPVIPAVLRSGNFRELCIPKPDLKVSDIRQADRDIRLTVCTDSYAHAVHFNLDDGIRLSDEYFDLLPGESREIVIYGAAGKLKAEYIRPETVEGFLPMGID